MPAADSHIPKYRHYKPKNLAVVRIDGHDHYLGRYDSPESHEKYHRLLAERFAHGRVMSDAAKDSGPTVGEISVAELILHYERHSEQYYVKNGRVTNQVRMIRLALRVASVLYGFTRVADLGPLVLMGAVPNSSVDGSTACGPRGVPARRAGSSRGHSHRGGRSNRQG